MDKNDVKKRTLRGLVWKFLERVSSQLIALVISVIIARILSPEDYSVVSIVTVFFAFANVLVAGGLNSALIQKKNSEDEDYSTVLHISVLLSVVCYGLLFFLAPWVAKLYRQQMLVAIFRVMGLIIPINAVKAVWCAKISASLKFKKFFFSTLIGTVISGVVGVVMAYQGYGPWALVVQQMSSALIGTIVVMATTKIRITYGICWSRLKVLFDYGWKVLVSSLIKTIYQELNPLIIGLKFDAVSLSYYTKGRSFPNFVSATTSYTLSAVLFPALSKFQDDKAALLRYTRLFVRQASFLAFPMMLGFFAVAENFVKLVLTDKWLPAIPYIRIFCVSMMFDMIHSGNCETIKAMGKSSVYLIMEIIKKTAYFVVIALFVFYGETPQMLAFSAIVCTLIATVVNSIPNIQLIGYSLGKQLADLLPNLITAAIMCVAVLLVGRLKLATGLLLALQIFTGVVVYLIENILIKSPSLKFMLESLYKIARKKL